MNRRNQKFTTYFVILSLLVIGIVYAILQANLQINGTTKISSNMWDIHFNNIQINNDSVSIGTGDSPATIDPNDTSKVDFSVTLSTPGDFYEFTVDVVNSGTIDGMIGSLTTTLKVDNVVVDTVPDYLNYTVTYEDGSEILENHLLEKNKQETYKVRLEFRTDIEELPEATTISTSLEPVFIQADDTAIKKKPYYACTFDGELVQGAEYTNGQYTYRYMQEFGSRYDSSTMTYIYEWQNIGNDGWGVRLTDPSSTDSVTSRLCTSINDKPIVSMSNMFYNSKTTNIDTSSFNTSNVTNMNLMFGGCSSLTDIDVTEFDTSNVTNMTAMFSECSSLTEINVTNFDTSNVTYMQAMFGGCSSLTELNLSNFDLRGASSFSAISGNMFMGTTSLKKIIMKNWKLPADMSHALFRNGATNSSPIEEIDVTGWDLSNTTNADGMFAANGSNGLGGKGLKRIIGLDTWDTSHITSMSQMFQGLSSLTTLDLSTFNTTNVTGMDSMFSGCTSLTTGYARTQADADIFNNSSNKPSGVTFAVKS